MKKIIFLIILVLFLSGCYDYKEVDNLAFISAIGLDYVDEEYVVTIEISYEESSDTPKIKTYTKTARDKDISKAIVYAADQLSVQANYTHLKLMIYSEEVAKHHLEELTDYFLRSTYFRDNFYVVTTTNYAPEYLLNIQTEENPVASTAITDLLQNNNYSSNSAIVKTYDEIIEEILTFGIDTCFSNIDYKNDSFEISGMSVFKDYEMQNVLSNDDAVIYNIMTKNFYRPIFSSEVENKPMDIAIATGKASVSLSNSELKLEGNLTGKVINNEKNIQIKDNEKIKEINKSFAEMLSEKIKSFVYNLQSSQSDALGISKSYYQKTREKDKETWISSKIDGTINFKINKKGLIYEVNDEKQQ